MIGKVTVTSSGYDPEQGRLVRDPTLEPGQVVHKSAYFSPCGLYRLELGRQWDANLPVLAGIGLNPSTAGAENDPTVLRLIAFARAWGYGSLMLGNLYAFRSPHPKALTHVADPVGSQNDMILQRITRGRCLFVMWGATIVPKLWVRERARRVLELVGPGASQVTCLGFTSDGSPIHPMARGKHRVPDGASPKVFPWRTWK